MYIHMVWLHDEFCPQFFPRSFTLRVRNSSIGILIDRSAFYVCKTIIDDELAKTVRKELEVQANYKSCRLLHNASWSIAGSSFELFEAMIGQCQEWIKLVMGCLRWDGACETGLRLCVLQIWVGVQQIFVCNFKIVEHLRFYLAKCLAGWPGVTKTGLKQVIAEVQNFWKQG